MISAGVRWLTDRPAIRDAVQADPFETLRPRLGESVAGLGAVADDGETP